MRTSYKWAVRQSLIRWFFFDDMISGEEHTCRLNWLKAYAWETDDVPLRDRAWTTFPVTPLPFCIKLDILFSPMSSANDEPSNEKKAIS